MNLGNPFFQNSNPKWSVLAVVILGSFMAILDTNIVNVALPKIMATFGSTVEQVEWVVTGYMIAFAIIMPTTNWLRAALGLKTTFILSLGIFCFGSALCGLAWDNDSLIFFRIIQALGGGAMMPVGFTLVTEAFPPQERGMAMGFWSIGAMIAPAIGPFLGGYLVDEVNWRSIFYINIPVGAAAVLAAFWVLSSHKTQRPIPPFDFVGFFSFSIFLAFLLVSLAQGQREGWDSDYILACFAASFLGLAVFLIAYLRVAEPLIDLRLFGNLNFLMANIVNFVRAVAIFGSMFLLPLFLQNLLDYKALRTGIILVPTAVSVAVVSPFSGLISDRIGPKIPLFLGTVLVAYSLFMYKDLSLQADYWFLFWPQVIRGVGLGLINAPLMSAAINSVRREQTSTASSLLTVIMQVGGAFGVALLGASLQRREFFHYAHYLQQFNDAFAPSFTRAQQAMQEVLLRAGHSPVDVVSQGKALFALWVHKQASVSAFGDAFVFSALMLTIGIIPALLIRNRHQAAAGEKATGAEG
jgi:DHA2 family multidrug resistance protein